MPEAVLSATVVVPLGSCCRPSFVPVETACPVFLAGVFGVCSGGLNVLFGAVLRESHPGQKKTVKTDTGRIAPGLRICIETPLRANRILTR